MSSSYTFKWPAGPQEVIVTGTFDSWSKTLPLVKQSDGSFEITVPLEPKETFYKYVVDGEWLTNETQKKQKDSNGIENNYLENGDFHTASTGSKIPEAGGLAAVSGTSAPDVSTTVMPKTEAKQQTLGEPGIFIPKDKDALAAFEKVEDVDSRNLSPVEKKKQKKKLKKIQYKARKKQRDAAIKLGSAGAASASTSASPEPELAAVDSSEAENFKDAKSTGSGADETVNESVVPVPVPETEDKSAEIPTKVEPTEPVSKEAVAEPTEPVSKEAVVEPTEPVSKEAVVEPTEPVSKEAVAEPTETVSKEAVAEPTETVSNEEVTEPESDEKVPTDGHPVVTVLAATEIIENIIVPNEQVDAPVAEKDVDVDESKSLADDTSVNPSMVAVHQANVVPTVAGTPEVQGDEFQSEQVPKEAVPESTSKAAEVPAAVEETDVPEPTVPEKNQTTLDPTVVGAIGAGGAEPQSPDAVAKDIAREEQPQRAIEPAISQPIEPETKNTVDDKKAKATPESVLAAPIKPLGAKEVEASPVHERGVTEEIIITQGGDDVNEIEEKIIAAVNGPVSVEQIQPTESEARELAEEAHIPESQLGLKQKPKKTAVKDKKVKDKKKGGFMAKLKKIFK